MQVDKQTPPLWREDGLPTPEHTTAHYKTPEAYFESLEESIMARIPEPTAETLVPPQKIAWWVKLKPTLYLAASFVGMYLCFEWMYNHGTPTGDIAEGTPQEQVQSASAYETYYEEYGQEVAYDDSEVGFINTQFSGQSL